jgi:hypothetical protein
MGSWEISKIEGIDGTAIVAAGGRGFREIVPLDLKIPVVHIFISALNNMFWVALATQALASITSWAMEWRQMPDSNKDQVNQPPAQEIVEV